MSNVEATVLLVPQQQSKLRALTVSVQLPDANTSFGFSPNSRATLDTVDEYRGFDSLLYTIYVSLIEFEGICRGVKADVFSV